MLALRLGTLRHRVTLQQEARVADGGGGFTVTWQDVATVWARVAPIRGEEALVHRQLEDAITHKVTMRYRAGVTAAMRLVHNGRVFNIREVLDLDERNRILELRCEENVAV